MVQGRLNQEECNLLLMLKEAVCKKCRSVGEKLFLKGEKCYSPKCLMIRKPYRPGIHSKKRRILSEYARALLEKQKVKWYYGLNERQMVRFFLQAKKKKSIALTESLASELERRLDNVVYRLGMAVSLREAKQLVSHKFFSVNGRIVNIPSYQVRVGDVIVLRKEKRNKKNVEEIKRRIKKINPPTWLELKSDELSGKVLRMPTLEDAPKFDFDTVVEFYSRK